MVIKDYDNYIFGAYCSDFFELKHTFYGNGETFLFTFKVFHLIFRINKKYKLISLLIVIISFILQIKVQGLDVEINLDFILIVIYMKEIQIGARFMIINNYQKNRILILKL